jgi:hypothetical protein
MLRLGMIVTFDRNDGQQTAFVNKLDYPNVELRFFDQKEKKLASKMVDVRQMRPVEKPTLIHSIAKTIIYNLAFFVSTTIMISLVFEVIHN